MAEKINLQNLPKAGVLAGIRNMLIAPEGHSLAVVDASSIEARVLSWIAGQWDLVDKFAAGAEIYCGFAEKVLGYPVRKPRKEGGIKAIEDKMTWARNSIGKIGVLGCFAAGSPVLTDVGWKPIEQVKIWDNVWDGKEFVSHEGVAYQGAKQCVNVNGIWMTPDHEVLTEDGWFQAQYRVTLNQRRVTCMGASKLSKCITGNAAGLSPSNVVAPVVESLLRTATTLSMENLHDVMFVLKQRLLSAIPDMPLCSNRIVTDFLPALVRSLDGATHDRIVATAGVESVSTALGFVIDDCFLNTWLNFRDGTTLPLKLTGRTTTADMFRVTCDSLPGVRTLETWDIIRAGSNRRFQVGSMICANCGYGMGEARLFEMADGQITPELALKIKETYRSENKAIVQFWHDTERAFKHVLKYGKPVQLDRGLRFDRYDDCDLVLTLPNGRELHYLRAHVKTDGRYETLEVFNATERSWEHLWGGTITENIVQAISRDVLVEAMLRLEDMNIHTALHCHDELVIVAPDDEADRVLVLTITEMSKTPVWAPRLPLAAEGKVMKCYSK